MPIGERPGLIGEGEDGGDVGDDEDGRGGSERAEAEEQVADAFLVHVVGGFVEDEERRSDEQGAGESEALALSAGEQDPMFADHGIVSVGELRNEGVGEGGTGGLFDLVERGVGAGVGDIVADGTGDEGRVLGDDADLAAQVGDVEFVVGDVIGANRAGVRAVEAQDDLEEGTLAGAIGTGEGGELAWGERERDEFEDLAFAARRDVAERQVVQGDLAGEWDPAGARVEDRCGLGEEGVEGQPRFAAEDDGADAQAGVADVIQRECSEGVEREEIPGSDGAAVDGAGPDDEDDGGDAEVGELLEALMDDDAPGGLDAEGGEGVDPFRVGGEFAWAAVVEPDQFQVSEAGGEGVGVVAESASGAGGGVLASAEGGAGEQVDEGQCGEEDEEQCG